MHAKSRSVIPELAGAHDRGVIRCPLALSGHIDADESTCRGRRPCARSTSLSEPELRAASQIIELEDAVAILTLSGPSLMNADAVLLSHDVCTR